MIPLVHAVICLAVLVVVPLGLRLVGGRDVAVLRRWWWPPALLAAAAVWLPTGPGAALLAVPYLLLVLGLALLAARRAVRVLAGRHRPGHGVPVELAVWTALATPAVAGLALVAERRGYKLFGFELDVLALTVAHFHFAGFTAALVAALVARAAVSGVPAALAALCVPGGTLLVMVGFFVGDEVELAGALVLTAGMWAAAWLAWTRVRPEVPDAATRLLLAVSALVLVATMALALDWALGEATGLPHLSKPWMAATHGVANAVGFGLCAVLAWGRLARRPL